MIHPPSWPARVALVVTLAAPSTTFAQTPPDAAVAPSDASVQTVTPAPTAPPDPQRELAREHFQRGLAAITEERWADAITELEQSRQIRVTASVAYNLGLAYRAVGRAREAIAAWREFIRLATDPSNAALVARADAYIQEMSARLSRLEVRVEPPSATVLVDGLDVTAQAPSLVIDAGRHLVAAQTEGYTPETRTVDAPAGGSAPVVIRLVPVAMASHVRVESNLPNALVRLDGEPVGFGTADETVRPGSHTLEVSAENFSTFRRTFTAVVGENLTVRAVLSDRRTILSSPWFWTGVGAVVVGAVIASIVLLSTTTDPYAGTWGTVSDAITLGGAR